MRVGDRERTSALEALGEHPAAGRLTLDEYGERSARVTVAKTAADLTALFDDLPEPHPVAPMQASTLAAPANTGTVNRLSGRRSPQQTGAVPTADSRSAAQKLVGAAAAASVFVALALFFITGSWLWFLLIPGISATAGAIWGPDWKEPRAVDRHHRGELGRGNGR